MKCLAPQPERIPTGYFLVFLQRPPVHVSGFVPNSSLLIAFAVERFTDRHILSHPSEPTRLGQLWLQDRYDAIATMAKAANNGSTWIGIL
jgi:hypothetical protein